MWILEMAMMIDFGDYVCIEQRRFTKENEVYLYKVVGRVNSNSYVDVPVKSPSKETIHDKGEVVLLCVQCGPYEKDILRYKEDDVYLKNETQFTGSGKQ